MKIYLNDPEQGLVAFRNAWEKCKEGLLAGKQFEVEIAYKSRTNPQNEKYHAMIRQIASQAQHMGAKWDAEDWKRLLIDQFSKDQGFNYSKVVPSLDGTGIVQLGIQSRKFTKEQAADFLEFLYSWGAQNGITYEMP